MKKLFLWSFFVVILSYMIGNVLTGKVLKSKEFKFSENNIIRVKRESKGIIEEIPFEEYIVGVLAGEMPVSFELEALKAQAVAARSYALTKINQNTNNEYDVIDTINNQVYLDNDKLKSSWGTSYDKNINKIKEAVSETRGEYLVYDGKVVNAFFFSTSVGKTENCEDVFGSKVPYLVSVSSTWDEEVSPVFSVDNKYTLNDFYAGLDLSYKDTITVNVLETTSTGRIKKIKINDVEFTGSDIAKRLSLKSSFFKIRQEGNIVYINTKGYGHGVGMSQYGALGMAKKGYKYNEILKHYYKGVEIAKM